MAIRLRKVWQVLLAFLRSNKIMGTALVASFVLTLYWLLWAPNRYQSEAIVMVESPSISGDTASSAMSSMLSSLGGGGSRQDQMVLQNYLLSRDMLAVLDKRLDLRTHYSTWRRFDPFSRLFFRDIWAEWFLNYYLSRVTVEYDDYSGQVTIEAQAFDPVTAQAIAKILVESGEAYINDMAHQLAESQVEFLETDVALWQKKSKEANQVLLKFQNEHQLFSAPTAALDMMGVITQLLANKNQLEVSRNALLGYLTPDNPAVVQMNEQIEAVDKQIAKEKSELTSANGKTLNSVAEEYLRLQVDATFAAAAYTTALTALESGRVEASRLIKKVSIIEHPTLPDASMEPERFLNSAEFTVILLLIAGILAMLAAVVRDHRD